MRAKETGTKEFGANETGVEATGAESTGGKASGSKYSQGPGGKGDGHNAARNGQTDVSRSREMRVRFVQRRDVGSVRLSVDISETGNT